MFIYSYLILFSINLKSYNKLAAVSNIKSNRPKSVLTVKKNYNNFKVEFLDIIMKELGHFPKRPDTQNLDPQLHFTPH